MITFENKVLRKIYGPVVENNQWRIRHNREIRDRYDEPDITAIVKSQRLRWFGHVKRRHNSIIQEVMEGRPDGKRPLGRPRNRWRDDIAKDLNSLGRDEEEVFDRIGWRAVVREAKDRLRFKWPWE